VTLDLNMPEIFAVHRAILAKLRREEAARDRARSAAKLEAHRVEIASLRAALDKVNAAGRGEPA
jgi:hypothetical protein